MHLLADARAAMLQDGVTREDDEAVDWGGLMAACRGDAGALHHPLPGVGRDG